jgi:hypothetical protein
MSIAKCVPGIISSSFYSVFLQRAAGKERDEISALGTNKHGFQF